MNRNPDTLRLPSNFIFFIFGLIIGVFFTSLFREEQNSLLFNREQFYTLSEVQKESALRPEIRNDSTDDEARTRVESLSVNHLHISDNTSVADYLEKKVRVLCWIMTQPKNHYKKAIFVKNTWAKRCSKFVFISTEDDPKLPAVAVKTVEDRDHLWAKTKLAFQYVHKHYINNYDWFLKADDDTYVILENLRHFLSKHDPKSLVAFGKQFKAPWGEEYVSGGAGYVLSRAAVKKLVENGPTAGSKCRWTSHVGSEDVQLGGCLKELNITIIDGLDEHNKSSFLPFQLKTHLWQKKDPNFWYWNYSTHQEDLGMECCSDLSVSFHYMEPVDMYVYEFLLYHMWPYGISRTYEQPSIEDNALLTSDKI